MVGRQVLRRHDDFMEITLHQFGQDVAVGRMTSRFESRTYNIEVHSAEVTVEKKDRIPFPALIALSLKYIEMSRTVGSGLPTLRSDVDSPPDSFIESQKPWGPFDMNTVAVLYFNT